MSKRHLAALSLIIALVACGRPSAEPSPELRALDDQFEEAFNTGDFDALAALFSEEVRFLPPGYELREGHEVVTETFREFMEEYGERSAKITRDPIEAMVAGNIGYVVGTSTREGPDGETLSRGKYVDIWQRVNGEWKITNHMGNDDRPSILTIPTVIVTHEVTDAARWLEAWEGPDSRHDLFARHGAPVVRVFRSNQNPNLTGLMVLVDDMEAFRAFIDSPEAEAARTEDGVVEGTLRVFAEVP